MKKPLTLVECIMNDAILWTSAELLLYVGFGQAVCIKSHDGRESGQLVFQCKHSPIRVPEHYNVILRIHFVLVFVTSSSF